uniref:Gamma-interferon-inducible lysosomal thiol reductase n=1 Tax=Clastoptera arizonana TaxID=38151 RepID=A0A1B6CR92_9HEMI
MASIVVVNALCMSLIFAFAQAGLLPDAIPKIPVSVYYESYCPDSVKFLTKQLYPAYTSPLASFLNITLVPFGKASYTKNESGAYTFNCHHGNKECIGNKVHACALNLLPSMDDAFRFINCASAMIMEDPKTEDYPGPQCGSKLGISYDNIQHCVSTSQGDDFLVMYGNKTKELEPPLTSVPYVVISEKHVDGESIKAVTDFKSVICDRIPGVKPAICTEKSSAINIQATLLPLFFAFILSRI